MYNTVAQINSSHLWHHEPVPPGLACYRPPNPPAPNDVGVLEQTKLNEPENLVPFVIRFPDECAAAGEPVALFHNIRSVLKHHSNIAKMKSYTSCGVIMLCETRTRPEDDVDIDGFSLLHRRDCPKEERHAYGTALYVRSTLAGNVAVLFGQETFTEFRGSHLRFVDIVGFEVECLDRLRAHGVSTVTEHQRARRRGCNCTSGVNGGELFKALP
ncbi:hypothetical protein ONE63_011308 [Megalurothrips usitatus]|uniref:Uncharacterized protein n=1 Tax=Megalurothrips usitatus TaxID=439358 RepID=A0AAV7X253_9NEOP|nr:hypothetical protein ONE63_011308 [Megalurothrips usitatus]